VVGVLCDATIGAEEVVDGQHPGGREPGEDCVLEPDPVPADLKIDDGVDVSGPERRPEQEGVGIGAAGQPVAAASADQQVLAGPAVERIAAAPALEGVRTRPARDDVGPG